MYHIVDKFLPNLRLKKWDLLTPPNYVPLRSKSTDCLARIQDIVSEWSDMWTVVSVNKHNKRKLTPSSPFSSWVNNICGVIGNMLTSSVVDRGFETRSGQTKDYKIGKHAALRRKSKDWLIRFNVSKWSNMSYPWTVVSVSNKRPTQSIGEIQNWHHHHHLHHEWTTSVGMLASSVVDRGVEPRSGQTKDYAIYICCISDKHATLRSKREVWKPRIQIYCVQVKQRVLPVDCCFS